MWADNVPGFSDPQSVYGYVPDIIAEKSGHTTIVEVETEDTVGIKRDRKQRAAFKKWANYKPNVRRFRSVVV